MSAPLPNPSAVSWFRRFFAAGLAALVLALAALSVNPELHHQLHSDSHDDDHGCAVVLFSSGVSLALDHIAITPPSGAWRVASASEADEIFLIPARYLRQPERGPPVV